MKKDVGALLVDEEHIQQELQLVLETEKDLEDLAECGNAEGAIFDKEHAFNTFMSREVYHFLASPPPFSGARPETA